ncbi:ABC transporter ATP-binding protein [Archaeoglobales archaeon]|nr:MAG: ABC transporter ATP-binding protein [Archaeoglobales archaeon]
MKTDVAIEAKDVEYIYPDGTVGISDVNLKILEKERIAITGANGSGKTTLLLLLSGLLKPHKGYVKVFGYEVNRKNTEQIRRSVGIVFQDPDDFLFNPTVREELLYTPAQLDMPYEEAIEVAEKYAKIFGIDKLLDKPPLRLSGGEKKKVALAAVMMLKPKILILDEPTANIDGKTRKRIVEMIEKFDGTLIIATHELDLIPKFANRVILLGMDRKMAVNGDLSILDDKKLLEEVGIV